MSERERERERERDQTIISHLSLLHEPTQHCHVEWACVKKKKKKKKKKRGKEVEVLVDSSYP